MADDAQNIYDMDPALPLPGASAGEGDDEIRQVKFAVQNSIAGNEGNEDWSAVAAWDRTQPDRYDLEAAGGQLKLGPRAINSLPKAIDTLNAADLAIDARLDALEAGLGGAATVPVGTIVMWSGGAIPAKWYLCNGQNGTPDLRDRFIVAAGGAYAVGATGGGAATTQVGGEHQHTAVTSGPHALTVAEMPLHGHPYQHKVGSENSVQSSSTGGIVTGTATSRVAEAAFTGAPTDTQGQQIGGTGGGAAHTHPGGVAAVDGSAHSHAIDVRPAYYALAFIMFKGV